ncbi:MAG: efflux RND transporter periplasmic adaptor subunit [Rhizobacter sp.]|nr:efflux RND transporter periplasmic adaptor subunit [Chlorobiales bacterium]
MTVKDSSIAPVPKKKSRRNLYIIVGIATVIIIGVIVFLAGRGNKEKPVMVTTEKAFTKTITQIVSATGKIQPEVEVKISPDVSGEIIELPVKEGMAVKKGDLLVKIKPDFYKTQVEQQAAALSGSRSLSLQSKAQVLKAEQEVKRAEELFKQKLLSESDYQTAKTTYESAKATFESSGFDIQRAASSLRQSQTQLSQTTVFAPMSGTISLLNSELGERVVGTSQMAGTEMLRVADLGSMEVRVNVNENDVVNVKVGDTARIGIDAYPNRKFTGVVGQIANTAKTTGLGTQEEVTNFEVKIRVLDKGLALRPGMSATADIETYTVKNAISVPIQSVTVRSTEGMSTEAMSQQREMEAAKNASGTNDADVSNEKKQRDAEKAERAKLVRVVFIKNGDAVKMQKVETGIADNTHIEIKSGLKAGDEVVSGSYRAISRDLKDGAKVMPEPQAKDAPKK